MEYRRVPLEILQGYTASYDETKPANVHIAQQFDPLLQSSSNSNLQYLSSVSHVPQHRTWLQKIGYYGLVILLFGTFSILIALAFITFLWKGVNATEFWRGDNLSSLWRTIVVSGWATRAVTLSSLVVRLAIAAQVGVCTSMFAAMVLERTGLSLHIAPEISLIRSSNTGPHHLASVLLRGSLTRSITCIMIPVMVMMTTSLVSQFSSTILLSDVETGAIIGSRNTSVVPFGMLYDTNYITEYQGNDYWATRPAFYPTFAEYSEPPSENAFWYDTGVTQRALAPFSTLAMRNALKEYSGMAKVLDVRTACVRPWLTASLVGATRAPRLIGHIDSRLPILLDEPGDYWNGIGIVDADFNCTIPLHRTDDLSDVPKRLLKEWPVSLCRLYSTNDTHVYGGAFLVVNTTHGTWLEVPTRSKTYNRTTLSASDGPWLNVDIANTNVSVALSLCFATAFGNSSYVHITSQTPHQESTLGWNVQLQEFDSYDIRRQLGVLPGTQASYQERGVLELDPKFDFTKSGSDDTLEFERMVVDFAFEGNRSAAMCSYCSFTSDQMGNEYSFWAHRDQVALFQDIIVSTRNPALAIQAHYFTLLQMAYYDFLTVAGVSTDAHLVFFEEALMPRSWRGYVIFASVVCCHLLCVLLAVVLFSTLTKLSRLGNSWQSIGQAVTTETESVLKSSTTMSDSEVRKRMLSRNRSTNEPEVMFRIEEINLEGQIGLVRQANA